MRRIWHEYRRNGVWRYARVIIGVRERVRMWGLRKGGRDKWKKKEEEKKKLALEDFHYVDVIHYVCGVVSFSVSVLALVIVAVLVSRFATRLLLILRPLYHGHVFFGITVHQQHSTGYSKMYVSFLWSGTSHLTSIGRHVKLAEILVRSWQSVI